jgi:tRNA U34 5-methylaminomethyl-2-thiouridine-forming methyltransferase MnmC
MTSSSEVDPAMTVHTTETRRNGLLRRVDWRFLLPHPEPEKAVCFSSGTIAQALKLVCREVMTPDSARAHGCGLAVAIDPGPECVKEASARLRPGGVLYAEMRPATAIGARRRLAQAGFEDVSTYRPWPALDGAFCWFPANSIAAKRYLFDAPRARNTIRERCMYALNLIDSPFFSRKSPVCMIARKSPVLAAGGLDEIVRERWSRHSNGPAPRNLSQLLLTLGARSFSKVVALFFEEPAPAPILAVKLARVPESQAALTREARILDAVHSAVPSALEGIPRVLFRTTLYGSGAFGETGFAGVPVFNAVDKRSYRDLARKATDWLIALAAGGRSVSREQWWKCAVEPVVMDFENAYAAVIDPGALAQARAAISRLPSLPLTLEHRDFSPWNILISREGKLGVLDWESSKLEGLPLLDLVYFLAHLAFFLDRAHGRDSRLRSYLDASNPQSFTGAIHAECFRRYGEALKLRPAAFRPLRLLTWMVHAKSEHRELSANRNRSSDRSLRNSLFFNLWRQELNQPAPSDARWYDVQAVQ